jgi:hypothetical protein
MLWHVTITLSSWPRLRQDQGDWFEKKVEPWYFQGRWKYIFTQRESAWNWNYELPKPSSCTFFLGVMDLVEHWKYIFTQNESAWNWNYASQNLQVALFLSRSAGSCGGSLERLKLVKMKWFLACYKDLSTTTRWLTHIIYLFIICISWITI